MAALVNRLLFRFKTSKVIKSVCSTTGCDGNMTITFEDFQKVDLRVGRVVQVEEFPEARKPSYKLVIDFGELGTRQSSAGLKPYYTGKELVGRQVVCVVNFPPRRVAGFPSEVLLLGAMQADGRVILLQPDDEAPLGTPIG